MYTKEQVIQAVREVIAEHGEDASNGGLCVYIQEVDGEVKPRCVAGQVFFKLETTDILGEFTFDDFTGSLRSIDPMYDGFDPELNDERATEAFVAAYDVEARALLTRVQELADGYDDQRFKDGVMPWSEALRIALA